MPYLLAQPCKCKQHANYSGTILAGGRSVGSLRGVGDFDRVIQLQTLCIPTGHFYGCAHPRQLALVVYSIIGVILGS